MVSPSPFLPDFACQGATGFLCQGCDPFWPVWLLALEAADGHLEDGTGVVDREPDAPDLWNMGEILLGEGMCSCLPAIFAQQGEAEAHTAEMGQEVGGVQNGIRLGEVVEVQEGGSIAVEQDVIQLQVSMG